MNVKTFALIVIITILIVFSLGYGYWYIQNNQNSNINNKDKIDIYKTDEKPNLISNVDSFLFTNKDMRLVYEGGPSHWGSRTIIFKDMKETVDSKIITLSITDESDMKGDLPKKQWNQKWEATKDGSIYIDDVLMLKSPVTIGQSWTVQDYTPVLDIDKKYTAKITITNISDSLDDTSKPVKKITTSLTIEDMKIVGGIYKENREFESGKGLTRFTVTEPTIADLELGYWLDRTSNIR